MPVIQRLLSLGNQVKRVQSRPQCNVYSMQSNPEPASPSRIKTSFLKRSPCRGQSAAGNFRVKPGGWQNVLRPATDSIFRIFGCRKDATFGQEPGETGGRPARAHGKNPAGRVALRQQQRPRGVPPVAVAPGPRPRSGIEQLSEKSAILARTEGKSGRPRPQKQAALKQGAACFNSNGSGSGITRPGSPGARHPSDGC